MPRKSPRTRRDSAYAMNFLIDQPVSPLLARWLRDQGHDANHVRERGLSTASDETIVGIALRESRILVTTDLDYPRIVALSRREGPAVILFRAGNVTDQRMLDLLRAVLHEVKPDRLSKAVVVATGHSLRVADLPIRR